MRDQIRSRAAWEMAYQILSECRTFTVHWELAIRSASESLASMITLFSMVLACSPIPRKALLQDLRAELDEACVGAIYAHIRCEPQHANPMNLSPH
jgi:hypothetical protein